MGMVGASPEELDRLASALANTANRVDVDIRIGLGRSITSNPWRGGDAQRFRSDWQAQLSPTLLRTAQTLNSQAEYLRRQADEQRMASSAAGPLLGGLSFDPFSGLAAPLRGFSDLGRGDVTPDDAGPSLHTSIDALAKAMDLPKNFATASALDRIASVKHFLTADSVNAIFDDEVAAELAKTPWLSKLSGAADAVGFLGNFVAVVEDPSDLNGIAALAGSGTDLIGAAADFAGKAGAGRVLGAVGGVLGGLVDAKDLVQSFNEGDALGCAWHFAHGAASVAGAFCPPVAVGLAAVDLSIAVGNAFVESGAADALAKDLTSVAGAVGSSVGSVVSSAGATITGAAQKAGDFLGGVGKSFGWIK